MRRFWREWLAAWETVQFEYQLVDAGDSVVALVDQWMRGRSTGIEMPLGEVRADLHVSGRAGRPLEALHEPIAGSLEAVGLSE